MERIGETSNTDRNTMLSNRFGASRSPLSRHRGEQRPLLMKDTDTIIP